MNDTYRSYNELAGRETVNRDFDFIVESRPASNIAIIAPHGGAIEYGTAELAMEIAGADHNLFVFRGLKKRDNRRLHITSSRFDHPECLSVIARCRHVLAIHGWDGNDMIYVGGLDVELAASLVGSLARRGLPATTDCPAHLAGREKTNICNRGATGRGAQLEIGRNLREANRGDIAAAVRATLREAS